MHARKYSHHTYVFKYLFAINIADGRFDFQVPLLLEIANLKSIITPC